MKKYLNLNENDLKALTYSRKHQKLVAIASGRSTMHSLDGDESKDNNNNSGVSGYTINRSIINSISWDKDKFTTMIGNVKEMLQLPDECPVTKIVKRMLNGNAMSNYNFGQRNPWPHLKDLNKNYITFDPLYMLTSKIEINNSSINNNI